MTTAFSGIGAPEQAGVVLGSFLGKLYSTDRADFHMPSLAAIEWNEFSRSELVLHPGGGPQHMYADILNFLNPKIREGIKHSVRTGLLSLQGLAKVVLQPGAILRQAPCVCCGRKCSHPIGMMHVAGTPCVDYSSMPGGSHAGALGSAAVPYMVWIGMRLLLMEALIIHENVPGFPEHLLSQWLGSAYVIMSLIISLHELGWPSRRDRRITVMVRKDKVVVKIPWSVQLVKRAHRLCDIGFTDFMVASQSEIDDEQQWAAQRGKNKNAEKRAGEHEDYMHAPDVAGHPSVAALHPKEVQHLREYRRRWPNCAYSLVQDPVAGFGMKSPSPKVFMTQIKNQGLVFVDSRDRWLCPSELLALQGFAVYGAMKTYGEPTTLNSTISLRKRSELIEQSGNTMPVPLICVPIIYSLIFTFLADPDPLASSSYNFSIRRALRATVSTDTESCDYDDDAKARSKKRRTSST